MMDKGIADVRLHPREQFEKSGPKNNN